MAILVGTENDDTLVGTADADTITGLNGVDTIDGGGGNDTIDGGDKADIIHGGDGDDTINSGYSTSNVFHDLYGGVRFGDGGGNQVFGDAGDDSLSGGSLDHLDGGDGNDTLSAEVPSIPFGHPSDPGRVTLLGGAGDDHITVRGYYATIDGGDGDDVVSISTLIAGSDPDPRHLVTLGAGADTLALRSVQESGLVSTQGEIVVSDFGLNDKLTYADNNGVDIDPFAAITDGGAGKRIGHSGADTILVGGNSGPVFLSNVNVANLTAANFGGHALGQIWTFGTTGADTLTGGDGIDYLDGYSGADILIGGAGADQLAGGQGTDIFRYLSATDSMTGGQDTLIDFYGLEDQIDLMALNATEVSVVRGHDVTFVFANTPSGQFVLGISGEGLYGVADLRDLDTGRGGYEIGSSTSYDWLYGGAYGDVIQAGSGGGTIVGGGGGDVLLGGSGSNSFWYEKATDSTAAAPDAIYDFETGMDQIVFTAFGVNAVSLIRSGGSTFLFANTSNGPMQLATVGRDLNASDLSNIQTVPVTMLGDATADTLIGGYAVDLIKGGAGDDVIIGGHGRDALYGQGGADTFKYTATSDSNNTGADTLNDFETGIDRIDLTALHPTEVSLIRQGADTFLFANTPTGAMQLASANGDINAGDILTGGGFGIYMLGDGGANTLVGGAVCDIIQAGDGADVIIGGAKGDVLYGQGGADVFKYLAATDSNAANTDSIFDFQSGVDKLDLTAVRTGASDLIGVYSTGGSTFVFVDLHGDGVGDMVIQLNGTPSITSGDYLF